MFDANVVNGFVGSLLHSKFHHAVASPQCHMEWWEKCCNDRQYIALAAPRRHAKSTAITFAWLLAALLFRKHQYAIIVSDTEGQAVQFLGDIKQELINNEDLISLFGVQKFTKLAETDIIVEMSDGYKFRVTAKGAEQKLRGLKWDNKRPDLIVCDDLENEEAVINEDRREKFRRWFYGALMPSISKGGKVIVVGTILHMDSLLEGLMPDRNSKYTVDEPCRMYSTKENNTWDACKYRAHNEDFSKLLWPENFSKDDLLKIKKTFVDRGLPDLYSQEYLNYPIDETTAYFRRDDFLSIPLEALDENLSWYAAVDFAVSTTERSDYTVIAIVGVNSDGKLQVRDIRRGRWDSQEIIEQMFSVQRRYKPELFVVERGTIEKSIGPFLNKAMGERGLYLNLEPMTPTKDKMSRARSLQARMRAGGVYFDKDASWYPYLEDEMIRFPKDRHDDQVDALSWIGLCLDKLVDAPTPSELDEEQYQQELADANQYQGRDVFTNY